MKGAILIHQSISQQLEMWHSPSQWGQAASAGTTCPPVTPSRHLSEPAGVQKLDLCTNMVHHTDNTLCTLNFTHQTTTTSGLIQSWLMDPECFKQQGCFGHANLWVVTINLDRVYISQELSLGQACQGRSDCPNELSLHLTKCITYIAPYKTANNASHLYSSVQNSTSL